jgi:GIY-YIG catalytic domain
LWVRAPPNPLVLVINRRLTAMAWVYILRGSSGRHHIGSTINLERRLSEHRGGRHSHNPASRRKSGNGLRAGTRNNRTSSYPRATIKAQEEPEARHCDAPSYSSTFQLTLIEQPRKLSKLSGLVVGSSPTQPKSAIWLRKSSEPLWKPFGRRWSTIRSAISYR